MPKITEYTKVSSLDRGDIMVVEGTNGTRTIDVDAMIDDTNVIKCESTNLFNPASITSGYYLNSSTGNLVVGADYFTSPYIDISKYNKLMASYTHIICFYNSSRQFVSAASPMNSNTSDITFTIPATAKYLRFSNWLTARYTAQIGPTVSRNDYISYNTYKLPNLRITTSQITDYDGGDTPTPTPTPTEDDTIIVDVNGSGDYTSFTKAVWDTVDSGRDIIVKHGVYNVLSEYNNLFGVAAVDAMSDSSTSFNNFQYGIVLKNRKVTFENGARLVVNWSSKTIDGTHRFCALRVETDVELDGLNLTATGTFYAIHDDYGTANGYTNIYRNCRVIGINLVNANCIGGGCGAYSRHIIDNCYFTNGFNIADSVTVRFHNVNYAGAMPELWVSNSYFNAELCFCWYGSQTSKMSAHVSGCRARSIFTKAENSSAYDVNNVDLYKWSNEETNPKS